MRPAALQERRNRQILADIVRTYIETGEPVSSRAISKGFEESLSTASIRNVMADLEDGGFLYQPHTSAGRVPTAAAYRFFAQERSEEHTSELQSRLHLVCRLLLEKKKKIPFYMPTSLLRTPAGILTLHYRTRAR